MNRTQAVNVYKEIASLSERMGYSTFNLKLTDKHNPTAPNYQLHITMDTDALINQQITTIAKKHKMEMKEENGEVVVFDSKKVSSIPKVVTA